ncbi:MAG TPA: hypothetical protein VE954_33250 [Oligoflexus sp.]|nr:hypothetical protein [Oligoflexus sp.]HYX37994.1 hypothetical protein [Oligoflexus sp.]
MDYASILDFSAVLIPWRRLTQHLDQFLSILSGVLVHPVLLAF